MLVCEKIFPSIYMMQQGHKDVFREASARQWWGKIKPSDFFWGVMLSHFSNVQAEGEYATWVPIGWNISHDSLISWFLGFVDLICMVTFSSSLTDNNNGFLIHCIADCLPNNNILILKFSSAFH